MHSNRSPQTSPFLHLTGGDINTLGLTTATHGEVDIEGRETLAKVTLGDDVELGRVVKDVVVEGEIAAMSESVPYPAKAIPHVITYLGMRSTPRSLSEVQLVFLTSAAALVSSSAESLPAQ